METNKRTFSQFSEDQKQDDVPMAKKQKIDGSLNISPSPSATEITSNSKSVDSIENKENIDPTLNNNECIITEHKLINEWYHFKIINKNNNLDYKWLKHDQLKHLNIYNIYLKQNKLQIDDVINPIYIPQSISDHKYDNANSEMLFLVQWKGYSSENDSWEPSEMLTDNEIYVQYCKQYGIEYIDIESEYNSAQNNEKQYDIPSINDIINAIDSKPYTNTLAKIKQYFEKLKQELSGNNNNLQIRKNKNQNQTVENKCIPTENINNENKNNEYENVELETIPIEYLSNSHNLCCLCKRKWKLFSLEFGKPFPICNHCPKNIRLGFDKKYKEDWFCPWCVHSAHELFTMINSKNDSESKCNSNFGTNGVALQVICDLKDKPYLYVKDGENWNTYDVLNVMDEESGNIRVACKNSKKKKNKNENIILSNIESKYIQWVFNNKTEPPQITSSKIKKVIALSPEIIITLTSNPSEQIPVKRCQIINTTAYFIKICCETSNKQSFDRSKIFKYSRFLREQKAEKQRKKNKFGANTIIKEYATLNSRYFNTQNEIENSERKEMEEIIPNYTNTSKALLSHLNISSINLNAPQLPQHTLLLTDIMQYSLTLIVGASGSGKTTLLRSLQSQNASEITFCNPSDLLWDNSKCIISQFSDVSIDIAMNNMSSIGLNNIRTWLKPFNVLSAGEQYRCGFARLLNDSQIIANKIIFMDEFTSVLDRTNARCMAAAIAKCIRKNKNKSHFVLASANEDIIRYLQPDLLILLGENKMKLIENPNNLNDIKSLFDVKAVLDLPQFALRKEDRNINDCKPIHSNINDQTVFNDLQLLNNGAIIVENEVCELKCKVMMDNHSKQTAVILDIEEFNGETITHIPCLQKEHIFNQNNNKMYFNIGVIYGPSGCGKTTSGIKLFGEPNDIQWDNNRNIASHFKCINNLIELLFIVDLELNIGLSKYNYLSCGEKHRIDICRLLQIENENDAENNYIVIDEFTSYLDRITAKKIAKNISDYIYKYNVKNIVFLCCKYDIISSQNGLYPSWIFDVQNKKIIHYKYSVSNTNNNKKIIKHKSDFKKKIIDITNLWNPPKIRLVLKNAERTDWPLFAKYHYMESSILSSAKCYSVWAYFSYFNNEKDNNNINYYNEKQLELVGFISIVNYFGKSYGNKKKDYREHRTVILPSFQGLGFGSRIADCMAEYLALHGLRMHSKTAHPRYGGYRNNIPSLWIPTKNNGKIASRIQWKDNLERCLYGNRLKPIGMKKKYYIHLYKLHNDEERGSIENNKLKERVIVANTYTKINR